MASTATETTKKAGKRQRTTDSSADSRPRKKSKKHHPDGVAHVLATFNNTVITITDPQGNTLCWSSASKCGFKGSKKSTPWAAMEAAGDAAQFARESCGMQGIEVLVKGPGPGREAAVRGLNAKGLKIKSITDVTPIAHNGVKPPKKRRV